MWNMPTHDEEPWEHDRRRLGDARARALWERRRRELGLRKRRLLFFNDRAYGARNATRRFARIALLAVVLAVLVTLIAAWSSTKREPRKASATRVSARSPRLHEHRSSP
jgi:hypothetical protein